MKIYTLTLNPAYDVHAFAESFAPYHENLAQATVRLPDFWQLPIAVAAHRNV